MVEKAKLDDIQELMIVIKNTVQEMNDCGNMQWATDYPQEIDFIADINKGDLFLYKVNGEIAGVICLNTIASIEYSDLTWATSDNCLVIHRMAVNPKFRRQGIANKLMSFAESLAIENGNKSIRTDTYSVNKKMLSLFEKNNYLFVGKVHFSGRDKPFYCYEKEL